MKALSLLQPWAQLLVCGQKRIETRNWSSQHRGPLLIHAGKRWTESQEQLCYADPFLSSLAKHGYSGGERQSKSPSNLPLGQLVGAVWVESLFATESRPSISAQEFVFGDYSPGRFGWVCSAAIRFLMPVTWRGTLGLFTVPDEQLQELLCADDRDSLQRLKARNPVLS